MEHTWTDTTTSRAGGRTALTALLVVQLALGYEWLSSGLTKVVRGDFPGGLGDELAESSEGVAGWYRGFLEAAVIPHANAVGYLIEIAELVTGVVLIVTAVAWLAVWGRLPRGVRLAALLATATAALGGVAMNVSFHLANGSSFPHPIATDSFEEAVDLDSLMAALELVLVAVSVGALVSLARAGGKPPHQDTERPQRPPSGRR